MTTVIATAIGIRISDHEHAVHLRSEPAAEERDDMIKAGAMMTISVDNGMASRLSLSSTVPTMKSKHGMTPCISGLLGLETLLVPKKLLNLIKVLWLKVHLRTPSNEACESDISLQKEFLR